MHYDGLGCLVRETEYPGNVGDSMAETSRKAILDIVNFEEGIFPQNSFETKNGFVRHMDSPWREDDMSSDQMLPYILTRRLLNRTISEKWLKIPGTTKTVSPGVYFAVRENWYGLSIVNMLQGFLFKIPYRWSDDDRLKGKLWKLEKSSGSSADYLNYVAVLCFLKRMNVWFYNPVSKQKMLEKITDYYQNGSDPEKNSQWIIDSYRRAIEKL